MSTLDGPTLRAVRESMGLPLRRIARAAGMSHGHLSKVERGEHGRPVTPAIMAAYERTTGVKLVDAAAELANSDEMAGRRLKAKTWRSGQLTELRRQGLTSAFGALAVRGPLGEPVSRLIDSTGRAMTPTPPQPGDVEQLEQLTAELTVLDLRYGGGLVSQMAKTLLRWAAPMLDAFGVGDELAGRIQQAISALALRAAWSAFDYARHEPARNLFRLALSTAARSGDRDLRAHVLADIAAQYLHTGYREDALEMIRMAEGDERVSAGVRMVAHGVKARAYATAGQADACRAQIEAAEQAYAQADPHTPGWVGSLRHPGHLHATAGHALAVLAGHTHAGSDVADARHRLTQAIDAFDPTTHTRALALCTTRLARLHLDGGDLEEGASWARLAVLSAATVTSIRLAQELDTIRRTALSHPDDETMRALVASIDATAADEPPAADNNAASPALQPSVEWSAAG